MTEIQNIHIKENSWKVRNTEVTNFYLTQLSELDLKVL